jgi:hypothetical protein
VTIDVYNFYLSIDKINFKDETDGSRQFLFKNIGILRSFIFLFMVLGFELKASHSLGQCFSLESCSSPHFTPTPFALF